MIVLINLADSKVVHDSARELHSQINCPWRLCTTAPKRPADYTAFTRIEYVRAAHRYLKPPRSIGYRSFWPALTAVIPVRGYLLARLHPRWLAWHLRSAEPLSVVLTR
jgi:hypothetical protein